jgi:PKHD-type hydroxylase
LSHPDDYDEGELELLAGPQPGFVAPKEVGTAILFPSYTLHRVTPVARGKRYALVIWCHGRDRFK